MLIMDSLCLNSDEQIGNIEITSATHMFKDTGNIQSQHCWTNSSITNYLHYLLSLNRTVSQQRTHSYSADKDYIYHSNGQLINFLRNTIWGPHTAVLFEQGQHTINFRISPAYAFPQKINCFLSLSKCHCELTSHSQRKRSS